MADEQITRHRRVHWLAWTGCTSRIALALANTILAVKCGYLALLAFSGNLSDISLRDNAALGIYFAAIAVGFAANLPSLLMTNARRAVSIIALVPSLILVSGATFRFTAFLVEFGSIASPYASFIVVGSANIAVDLVRHWRPVVNRGLRHLTLNRRDWRRRTLNGRALIVVIVLASIVALLRQYTHPTLEWLVSGQRAELSSVKIASTIPQMSFNSKTWRDRRELRAQMADDLTQSGSLLGLYKPQSEEWLGQCDGGTGFAYYGLAQSSVFTRLFLTLQFDSNGRVNEVSINEVDNFDLCLILD